jgi:hypothetical protein
MSSSSNPPTEQAINEVLAAVAGIGARDGVEGMLATQMVATHFAAMTLLRRLKGVDTTTQQDSAGNLAVKLLRTYAAQVEALQRWLSRNPYGPLAGCRVILTDLSLVVA